MLICKKLLKNIGLMAVTSASVVETSDALVTFERMRRPGVDPAISCMAADDASAELSGQCLKVRRFVAFY